MSDIEKDCDRFELLTGMLPPGRDEAVFAVSQQIFERHEVRSLLWEMFCETDKQIAEFGDLGTCKCGLAFPISAMIPSDGDWRCVNCLQEEVDRFQAIVDKLLKTADGVPILPGMQVWYLLDGHPVHRSVTTTHRLANMGCVSVTSCYSTRETAEAAKESPTEVTTK